MGESIFTYMAKYRKVLREDGLLVFMGLMELVDANSCIQVNPSELAKNLNMQIANVNRAIERLTLVALIIKGEKIGEHRVYRLSYHLRGKSFPNSHKLSNNQRSTSRGTSHLTLVHSS